MAKNKDKKVEDKKSKKKAPKESVEQTKKGKKSKEVEKKKAPKIEAKPVKAGAWDESTGGGGDFFKLKTGETEVLIRVRSVISLGQCVFDFQGKKDDRATSAMGLVLECWPFKIKGDKIKLMSKEPAIVFHTFKALDGNKDSHWTAMKRELGADNPGELQNAVGIGTIKTTDKKVMYLQKRIFKTGLAEKKACPKLTAKGHVIPNLNEMTKPALLELNPLFQIAYFMEKAVNYTDTTANKLVDKIRKDKPNFAKPKPKENEKGKGKKKGKKKKLSDKEEY